MASVINVKASFRILESHKLLEDSDQYLFYYASHLQILKAGAYTYSIMGRDHRFVNITGCSSIEKLYDGIELFKCVSQIKLIDDVKINSISFVFKVQISDNTLSLITSNPCSVFNIKRFPKFSGICFKHINSKIAGNFFSRSGKFLEMGAKDQSEIYRFITDLEKIGFVLIS